MARFPVIVMCPSEARPPNLGVPLGTLRHKMTNDTKGRLCAQAHNEPIASRI